MLLRCFLIHKNIFMLTYFSYLPYLCPCVDLGLFMLYRDLFFIFNFIFVKINRIIHVNRETCYFRYFLECFVLFLDDSRDEGWKNFQIAKVQPLVGVSFCVIFFASFSLLLLMKVLFIKKRLFIEHLRATVSINTAFKISKEYMMAKSQWS